MCQECWLQQHQLQVEVRHHQGAHWLSVRKPIQVLVQQHLMEVLMHLEVRWRSIQPKEPNWNRPQEQMLVALRRQMLAELHRKMLVALQGLANWSNQVSLQLYLFGPCFKTPLALSPLAMYTMCFMNLHSSAADMALRQNSHSFESEFWYGSVSNLAL